MKAICSFSGGLDSMLASRIMLDQGIGVEGLYFRTGFGGCGEEENVVPVKKRAEALGMKLTVADVGKDLMDIVSSPRFGFGRNLNPCIDCHALFFRKCAEYMKKRKASFIVTGEVVGERPMSQRKSAILDIDKFTGLEGLILRPLSAKLLDPTIPEKKGWVDREKLHAISGRSRRPQRMLAEKFGIKSYPNAAGGCLLTEKEFSRKLRDLMEYNSRIGDGDIVSLRSGRHFRLTGGSKLIIGRDEKENMSFLEKVSPTDICFMTVDVPGPVGLLTGKDRTSDRHIAASIIAAYSDAEEGDTIEMKVKTGGSGTWRRIFVVAPSKRSVNEFLV